MTATIAPSNATNKTVTWTSSNTSVATVSSGKVTAVAAGTATITAKSSNGKTATCKVTVTNPAPTFKFTDVPSSAWYFTSVQWAVANNITSGTSATTFSPDAICTRAQAVTFLWNAAGKPDVSGTCKFKDVSPNAWYYKAVLWAVQNGVTSGTSATTFSPDTVCNRAQIVTFLWNAAGKPDVSGACKFKDVSPNAWYYKAVLWAVQNGVTSGTSATTFSPDMSCTRAQIVTFLYNYMGK